MAADSQTTSSDLSDVRAPSHTVMLALETGGLWTAEETAHELGVSVEEVHAWNRDQRVLGIRDDRDNLVFPACQFTPGMKGVEAIVQGLDRVIATADGHLHPRELFGILATHQDRLASDRERTRTGFAALATGEISAVVAMIAHVVAPDDVDAPRMRCSVCDSEKARPTGITDPDLGEIFLCARHGGRSLDYT